MHQIAEVNARAWHHERSQALGRPATLDDLDDAALDRWMEQGFTWLYLHGVWRTGERSRQAARQDHALQAYLARVMPDHQPDDVVGWGLAPAGVEVDPALGGAASLARLRARCRAAGVSLMLDFVPSQVGLDHPWATERPEYLVRGTVQDHAHNPQAWVRIGDQVYAHGRDPFFAPWRDTLQLDYSNPEVQAAMIGVAKQIAGMCDGLRCDVAMLLLPDVFESTWGRRMEPFWPRCLAEVRHEHPGTIFMAEVYWNREYELQQAGFDFTYDKILYDRLLIGEAEAIRGHLRAAPDYQEHCVRFLENHVEQRAATRFSNAEHYRGALFICGMIPGMLLLHDGQERGLTLHTPLQLRRRPPEPGSPAHAAAFRDLLELLGEPARQHGRWRLLEPLDQGGRSLIACWWQHQGHAGLLVVVNAGWAPSTGRLDPGALADRDILLADCLTPGDPVVFAADRLREHGLEFSLPAWGTRAFRVFPSRGSRSATPPYGHPILR